MITSKTALLMNVILVSVVILVVFKIYNGSLRQPWATEEDLKHSEEKHNNVQHMQATVTPSSGQELSTPRDAMAGVSMEKSRDPPDWHEIFSFVPYSLIYCNDLTGDLPKNDRLPENLKDELARFEKVVSKEMEMSGQRYGGSDKFVEMQLVYAKLSVLPFIKTVCETGFNAGHSAFVWLLGKNDTKVYSFDIGTHSYGYNLAKYLQKRFPGQLEVTWGNSIETLPQFREEHPEVKCDVMLIDGGHSNAPCQADYDNFRLMANVDNLVILDDYPRKLGDWLIAMGDVWEPAKRRGEVSEIFSCVHKNRNHGFAIAHYNTPF